MHHPTRLFAVVLLVLVGCGDDGPPAPDGGADGGCAVDSDCDDGIFCNGAELCTASRCESAAPACGDGERCDEDLDRCVSDCENPDMDGDGHDAVECGGDDCDDGDIGVSPSSVEVCDAAGVDEDCDPETLGPDRDGDGFAALSCCNGDRCGLDCDDFRRAVAPGAAEVCNLVDDDCDGSVDESVAGPGFRDRDGDRHGDPDSPIEGCPATPEFAFIGDDCDDMDPSTPGAEVLGDGVDNDCDSAIDEGEGTVLRPWWPDADGDGYGDSEGTTLESASPLAGYAPVPGDCDEGDPEIHPGAMERCNGLDDDCNGSLEGEDDDGDGVPDIACGATDGDCDDRNPEVRPGATEICDGVDNDCDDATAVDEGCTSTAWYPDADGDGWGVGSPVSSATPLNGHSTRNGDCDDEDPATHPTAAERCDGEDQDCDSAVDETADLSCGGPHLGGLCAMGACNNFCEVGWGDCDGSLANGCEIDFSNPGSCGGCDTSCPVGPNGIPRCVDFECSFECAGPFLDCNDDVATDGCETNGAADEANCGGCGIGCRDGEDTVATCTPGGCTYDCAAGFADCDGDLADPTPSTWCEIRSDRDPANCGTCENACDMAAPWCLSGACGSWPLESTGLDGAFTYVDNDGANRMVLPSGRYDYAGDVVIPAGKTLRVSGTGILDLRATGSIVVMGTIDVSGANGSGAAERLCGNGGDTGTLITTTIGSGGDRGGGGVAGPGGDGEITNGSTGCSWGGLYGGGNGGDHLTIGAPGGGGGGAAGGAGGGSMLHAYAVGVGGGADGGTTAGQGGVAPGPYAGSDGSPGMSSTLGGGGGSIGSAAAADLAVTTTFEPGSGGGGGASSAIPNADNASHAGGAGGAGGGGGGALRLAASVAIVVPVGGAVRANGGLPGGISPVRFQPPDRRQGCGGGGSGGVIYLASPRVEVQGILSAAGASGVVNRCNAGGDGGLGRIRVSTYPAECLLAVGNTTPPTTCTPSPVGGIQGAGYVAVFPD
ncbi:MAG: putative metal-binding motif-containing protein [Deltaproteobacteria bacterium]|nr:putative metal-binding motif-containing protein [Deltaproteobacteria bacterium]